MYPTTLIIGGCRSGKSRHALELGRTQPGRRKLFVATCVPRDPEMHDRVERHQAERGALWQTLEAPLELADTLSRHGPDADVAVVDCLTLWISNLMLSPEPTEDTLHRQVRQFCEVLATPPCPLVVVTNEVGTGIVPENPLARRYRDWVGHVNQQVARSCRQVIWMVAGIAVPVKTIDL